MGNWTPLQVAAAEKHLKKIGNQYGEDWAKNSSAASRIASTPITVADAVAAGMSADANAPAGPIGPPSAVINVDQLRDQLRKRHYPHVPGGSSAKDPYAEAAARAATRKAVAAVDQYLIGNIPVVSSIFGSVLTSIADAKRIESAQQKLQAGPTDPMKEAKYRSKGFPDVAKELESALKEVRIAVKYFENTANAGRANPTCDYIAHLYGFLKFCELRIDDLDSLVRQLDAYSKALHSAIQQANQRLQGLDHNGLNAVLTAVVNSHSDTSSLCGKNCCCPAIPKALPTPPTSRPLPQPPPKH